MQGHLTDINADKQTYEQYVAALAELNAQAQRDLDEIAKMLDCTVETTLCDRLSMWYAHVRFRNNKSKKCVQWVKSPSDHSYDFGACNPASDEIAGTTVSEAVRARKIELANLKVLIQARDFILTGGFSIRMSKTRKLRIPRAGSVEELRFIFEVEGRAG